MDINGTAIRRDFVQLTVLGAASGMRSLAGPAQLALRSAGRGLLTGSGGLDRVLTRAPTKGALAAAAVGEMFFDKSPWAPDRTSAGSLAGRAALGAVAAGVLARRKGRNIVLGAILGAAGAVAGAYVFHRVRRLLTTSLGLPDLPVAIAEDLLAIATARLALRG